MYEDSDESSPFVMLSSPTKSWVSNVIKICTYIHTYRCKSKRYLNDMIYNILYLKHCFLRLNVICIYSTAFQGYFCYYFYVLLLISISTLFLTPSTKFCCHFFLAFLNGFLSKSCHNSVIIAVKISTL